MAEERESALKVVMAPLEPVLAWLEGPEARQHENHWVALDPETGGFLGMADTLPSLRMWQARGATVIFVDPLPEDGAPAAPAADGSWQARAEAAEAKLAAITDACRSIPTPIAKRLQAIIGSEEGHDDAQPAAPGELCGCRCKNPKGKCGCCDESLNAWYAAMDEGGEPDA